MEQWTAWFDPSHELPQEKQWLIVTRICEILADDYFLDKNCAIKIAEYEYPNIPSEAVVLQCGVFYVELEKKIFQFEQRWFWTKKSEGIKLTFSKTEDGVQSIFSIASILKPTESIENIRKEDLPNIFRYVLARNLLATAKRRVQTEKTYAYIGERHYADEKKAREYLLEFLAKLRTMA